MLNIYHHWLRGAQYKNMSGVALKYKMWEEEDVFVSVRVSLAYKTACSSQDR